ncbi:ATP-dependent RNA helicase dhx29, partial [Coemansia spiralis]
PVSAPYDSGCEDGPATPEPEPESESEPEPNPEPEASALASPSVDGECTTAGSGSGTVAEDDLLTQLVDKLSLEDFGLDCAYDSDEDPGTVCGRRRVRLQALEETVDYARHHGRSDVSDAATALIAQERQSIRALEEDYIYAADQVQAEYERLWPAYYDALLEELRRIREYAAAEAAAAAMYAEAVEIPQVADPAGLLDASDDECGLDRMFDCNDDDDAATIIAPTGPVRRILSTVPPHGWTGAPMREMVDQLVHHYDKQATIRYRLTKSHPGTVCTFVVEWSTPAKAARILATQRPLAAGSPAAFAVRLLEHSWTLPADLAGHSPRDAKDLGALVFLYMQPEISHQLSSRLPPALHALWDEWGEAEKSSCRAFRMQHRSERIAFLYDLHSQYQQALAAAANGDADSGLRPEPGEGRRRRQQQQQQQQGAACQLRKRLWKRTTIGDRQRSAQWQAKYGALQAQLPVRQYRREVVAAMVASRVVIVRGATGSGKSSQVPQFILQLLLASRYTGGRILCTQPRRISATSIATRVSQELGDPAIGDRSLVGYQIRHNAHCSDANALIFCTTGVLLRRLISDPMLTDIKCVICDEVQERTLELDYLLIVLRRLLARRRDLRLVLMSATIDMDMFASYFDGCAMVDIPGRAFPVRTMFLDHLVQLSEYALPRHSQYAIRSRTDTDDPLPSDQLGGFNRSRIAENPDYVSPLAASIVARMCTDIVNLDLIQRLVRGICQARSELPWALFCREPVPQGSVLVFLPGIYEIRRLAQMLQSDPDITVVASVIPLHSSFANERPFNSTMTFAELAFAPPTAGLQRKVVLSTNVAETGITIPDVTIVIDCGL